jgi:CRISPR-associated protein Csa3
MMRTYLAPIGFNSTSVTRAVSNHGISGSDEVVLVRPDMPDEDRRATEATEDVRRFLQEVDPGIELTVERIDHTAYDQAVLECSNLLLAPTGNIVVAFSGGPRDVLVPFTTAALAHAAKIDSALFFSDLTGGVEESTLPQLTTAVSDPAFGTLGELANMLTDTDATSVDVPQLTERTGRAKSTVTRHVNNLEAADLVETWREGKIKHIQLTTAGQLHLDVR